MTQKNIKLPRTKKLSVSHSVQIPENQTQLAIVIIDESQIKKNQIEDPYLKKVDDALGGMIQSMLALKDFEGKWLQTSISVCHKQKTAKRVLLIGAGKKQDFIPARARALGLAAASGSMKLKSQDVLLLSNSALLATHELLLQARIGFGMGIYQYPNSNIKPETKTDVAKPVHLTFVNEFKDCLSYFKSYESISESIHLCRLLQDGPPNIVTPKYVSSVFKEQADELNLDITIMGREKLKKLGFGAMLAVASGSAHDPQFVVMEYKPKKYSKTIAFVGKGLTMDTGGYSLKTPSTYQEGMKYDMSGAAVALSSVLAIAKLGLNVHVYGIGALCENMVDANAYRVGDVLTSYSGKTIEVIDTDAEGRIVLSDALYYAANDLKPDYIVEYSTLTGAIIVALGHVAAGLFATDKNLESTVLSASEATGERVHAFPIWEEMSEDIKGSIADVMNVCPGKRWAGSMIAAAFLKEFVKDVPYAHIDIAGVADANQALGYNHKGGSGYGIQLSVKIAESLQ